MKSRSLLPRLVGALLLSCVVPALAEDAAPAPDPTQACGLAAAERVQERYRDVRDLRAEFVQTSQSVGLAGGGQASAASGSVVLQVPGKMRWSYEKPEPSLIVSDGQVLWIYDPAYGEAQKLPASSDYLSGAAIQFLLGQGDLAEEFEIESVACDAAQAELRLTPREPATYEFLTIWVDPAKGLIQRTEIADLLGNRTRVEFHEMVLGQQPDASLFRFDPPEGVRVVELEPAS